MINLPPFNQKQIQACCRRSGILIVVDRDFELSPVTAACSNRCLYQEMPILAPIARD
jgi:hypothetical protein